MNDVQLSKLGSNPCCGISLYLYMWLRLSICIVVDFYRVVGTENGLYR